MINQSNMDFFLARSEKVMQEYTCVQDLLADIRHYCDKYGHDYAELDKIAYRNYIEEKVPS